jgi:DNA-directed RNA polymerase delta subunit
MRGIFLKGDSSPIKPFMEAINRVDNNLTKEEEDIYDKVPQFYTIFI